MKWTGIALKNVLALLMGTIIAMLLMEGILNIYNPFDFRVRGDKIVLPANKRYVIKKDNTHKKFDKIIIHTKNSLGFRGEEPPKDFLNHLTIITVGGSTTECTFLSDGKTWTDMLGKKLRKDFNNMWINNAGFDGQSTFGHIILMQDFIAKIRPKMVLFLIGANDFGIDDSRDQDKEMMIDEYVLSSFKGVFKSMANHSELFSLGLNMYRYWKAVAIGVEHKELDFEVYRHVDISKYFTDETRKMQSETLHLHKDVYAKGFEARLQTLINTSRKYNIEPVFITQPSLYGDVTDDVTNIDLSFTKFPWTVLEVYNDVTRRIGEKNNIRVIDLAKEMPKSSRYYYDWFHFTNSGAEKVAEIIYNKLTDYLREKYPLYSYRNKNAAAF